MTTQILDPTALQRTPGQLYAEEVLVRRGTQVTVTELRALIQTGGALEQGADVVVPVPRIRPWHVRDLFVGVPPATSPGGQPTNRIAYIREILTGNDNGASATAEGAAKAEVTIEFEGGEDTLGKVTAWVPITDEIVQDAPGLAAYVDGRLAEMLAIADDYQLLNGDGTGVNLNGMLQDPDIQTQAAVTDDLAATAGLAIAKIENVGGYATGIIVNPLDYWAGRLERHTSSMDRAFDDAGNLLGIPTIRTIGIARGTMLVGAFPSAATLRDRGVVIRRSESHADYFVKNKSAVVAERREQIVIGAPHLLVNADVAFS